MADCSYQGRRSIGPKIANIPCGAISRGGGGYFMANLSVEQICQSFLIELWLIARIKAADRLAPKQRETGKSLPLAAAVTAPALLL